MRNRGILCSIIIFSVCGLFQGDSAPFPPPCRCQQNGGVKQKFVVVAAMVGQQLPCALRRAMCPASGDDAVRRHFLAPCPFLPGQLSFSEPPLPCASCAFPLPRACGCPAPGTYGVTFGGAFQLLARGPYSLGVLAVRELFICLSEYQVNIWA